MGKPTGKKKSSAPHVTGKQSKTDRTSKTLDEDTAIFINMSQELKEEGNKLFQKHDHEGAMLKYEKAVKLLPKNHIDVANLRTNMAACYMQMGLGEFPRAINECNLALEVSPKYSKALLKRAKCYESLNRLDLALRDVNNVLSMEPNNLMGLEILESIKKAMIEKGINFDEKVIALANVEESGASRVIKKKKKNDKVVEKGVHNRDKVVAREKAASPVIKDKQMVVTTIEEDKVVLKDVEEDKVVSKDVKEERVAMKDVKAEKVAVKDVKAEKLAVMDVKAEKVAVMDVKAEKVAVKDVKAEKVIVKGVKEEKMVTKTVKLVLGEDIRWAHLPLNCSIDLLRDIVRDRYPGLRGVLVKYRDPEGDLITITNTEELRLAESLGNSQGSLRFYVVEINPNQEPAYGEVKIEEEMHKIDVKTSDAIENVNVGKDVEIERQPISIDDWIVQFARLFKNHVGFDSDSYLDLHELGMKLYSEAMEDAVTSDEAQELFDIAADKFQEMAALALFNWGNVHMSRARKRVFFSEDGSKESVLAQVKNAYDWARKEYVKAGSKYQEALKIKPDFYEGLLALGQQQFEQAKLCWYHAIGSKLDLESGPSEEVLDLYNKAEDSMERGMQMWEEMEEQRLNGISKFDKYKTQLQKLGLDGLVKDTPAEEEAEQAANMSAQIYLLWGTMLYERSVVEFKLELPTWEECLEVAVEKFELAGASPTDIAVMIKNHCSNETALEGLGFKIDEIVQAWNEMYDVKRWETGIPSFRLEPLFRRRVPKLHQVLENV